MTHIGIMTLGGSIPYRKPVLKSSPVFVNARGVIRDLENRFGKLVYSPS